MCESSVQDMKKEEPEVKSESAQEMNKDSQDKTEDSAEKKEDHPLSDASPSLTQYSPSTPPSLRSRKPPFPPLHFSPHSSISSDHSSSTHGLSPTQDKRVSPPPQKLSLHSSPASSISSDHLSVTDGLHPIEDVCSSPMPPENPASPVLVANRFQVEPKVVIMVDAGAQEGVVGVKRVEEGTGSGGDGSDNRRLRPDVYGLLRSKEEAKLNKVLLGLRIIALVFCLISFSVLAADRKQGWAVDSFYWYKEFKYSLSVNVIGFVYSGLQASDIVKYLITRKHIVEHPLRGFFNFFLDQILTYLLMSASSSAATRAYEWESYWGQDKFPEMANASVALSFVAFVAFASASLVSGYILCRFRTPFNFIQYAGYPIDCSNYPHLSF